MKACLQSNQCTVPENTILLQDSTNSMRNLHLLLKWYNIEGDSARTKQDRWGCMSENGGLEKIVLLGFPAFSAICIV